MDPERAAAIQRHKELKAKYGRMYDTLLSLFRAADPAGFGQDAPVDEYALEVETVLPRLRDCRGAFDVQEVLYHEFEHWCGPIVGELSDFGPLATDIWEQLGPDHETPNKRL